MQLVTTEWAKAYKEVWNGDEKLRKKLKRFDSVFKYAISDREDLSPMIFVVEKGEVTYAGTDNEDQKVEFDMWADSTNWQRVFSKDISVKRAMMSSGFNFKGPKLKAMSNMRSFERSIELMIEMPDMTI